LKKAVKGCKNLIVIDRAVMSGGAAAPVCAEVKSSFMMSRIVP